MNPFVLLTLRALRKVHHQFSSEDNGFFRTTEAYCDFKDQEGNDRILDYLNTHGNNGVMLSKWGAIEFNQAVRSYFRRNHTKCSLYGAMATEKLPMPEYIPDNGLYYNAGVFPFDAEIADRFGMKALDDCKQIDILGSYIYNEKHLCHEWKQAIKVNLEAYYTPWLFNNPWTQWLKGKRVLVVHPFVDSIQHQYHYNRTRLFKNPDVLPEFKELLCLKAVQTQAGEKVQFKDWFEALHYMENEIDKFDYDVAIIGCGAYGMSLAAHVKRQGKVALHLAGWTQMLFGVYGERWMSQQMQYRDVINSYWIRPTGNEVISNASKIENGAYW